ncbi:MAG: radical SAM protein, partial [Nitrospiria bacterium]
FRRLSGSSPAPAIMRAMRVLLLTPPLTQLNTPYPATTYLAGFHRSRGLEADQADLGIETALALLSRSGLARVFDAARSCRLDGAEPVMRMLDDADAYLETIDPLVRFLQGRDPSLATRIASGTFLPQGPRSAARGDDRWAFGTLGTTDRARHVASLCLDDLTDFIAATVDPMWGLSRYAERLAASAASFDALDAALREPPGLVAQMLEECVAALARGPRPDLIGLTVPFPGNLYGALRSAAAFRRLWPGVPIALGGGYVNTELRALAEPRLFDYVDYVTLDAGERPLLCLLDFLAGGRGADRLCRTFLRRDGRVVYANAAGEPDVPFEDTGTPTYRGLDLSRYLSIVEVLNPMHRLWSDGRWNKLTVAHGCYWKQCTFCDVGLDYIRRYEPASAERLADQIDALVEETGQTGFHFVDEAAPPARLADLALALLERGRRISWWGNVRFEAAFTPDLCRLLAASGCLALSGGLETASDRLLALMKKGVTVSQAARVTHALTRAGIMVHAYLMYGFPTETPRETIETLERVRQFFDAGLIQSAYWHRFTATAHSPIGADPAAFGIVIDERVAGTFARNDLPHRDPVAGDLDALGPGLASAVYHYMHGLGLERDVRSWFDGRWPKPRVSPTAIRDAVRERGATPEAGARIVWLGRPPRLERPAGRGAWRVRLGGSEGETSISASPATAEWLAARLTAASPRGRKGAPYPTYGDLAASYPGSGSFEAWTRGRAWGRIGRAGLVIL